MLLEEIKNIKSNKRDLRSFGIAFGVILAILGGLFWWREKGYYPYFLIISLVFFLFGLIFPILLKPVQKVWMTFAVILGWFMTRVILSVLFYIVFTFIGLLARLFRKEFLDLRIDNTKKSYWIARESKPFERKDYERQF